jgi:deoxyhypusine synthase
MEPTEDTPQLAQGAVLVESEEMPEGTPIVQGINFEEHVTIDQVLGQYLTSGFQATNFGWRSRK